MRVWKTRGITVALALLAAAALPAGAQVGEAGEGGDVGEQPGSYAASSGARRSAVAVRVPAGPAQQANWREDPLWQEAVAITEFVQQEPVEGATASERTEVRILYDDRAIYVGAWLYDSDASRIMTGERRRDASLGQSDSFLIIFDTFHDLQNGFVFGTHPGGIEYDGQVINEGRGGGGGAGRQQGGAGGGVNVNWDGAWTVTTERDERGWYAFFRIPFSTLRYGSAVEQTWGLNFSRSIARKNEQVFWSPISRQHNLYRVSSAGVLSGLEVPAKRLVVVTPYALASAQRIPAAHEGVRYPYDFGADAKVGLTQGLTLDLTLNTDFAQVEVDEQQLDLTRFNLFFPEKRPFFLENAGLFAVGSNNAAQMFFSRRIGISRGGAPVPIDGGGRVTGRAGGFNVGLLHIYTDELEDVQAANRYSVARVARELGNRTQIGAIVTDRTAVANRDDYGRTYAVDGRLGIGEGVTLNAVLGASDRPGYSTSREAIILSGEYRSRDWRVTSYYDQVGTNFVPEVGFLRRSSFRAGGGQVMHYYRTPSISWLRELRPHLDYHTSYSLDGLKETSLFHVDSHVAWENGAMFSPALDLVFDGLSRPFAVAPGINVPTGEYSGWVFAPRFNTSTRFPVVMRTGADLGHYLSGNRRGGFGSVDFRQGGTLAGRVRFEHNKIDLAQGSFDVTLAQGRIGYSFTPNLFLQSLLQYNSQSKIWSGNVRLGWLDTAGTGLFLVYNERQMIEGIAGPLERSLLIKFTRQFDVGDYGRDLLGW
jgi:hypothetical protein